MLVCGSSKVPCACCCRLQVPTLLLAGVAEHMNGYVCPCVCWCVCMPACVRLLSLCTNNNTGGKAFIARAHTDGVLLELWGQGRLIKVSGWVVG